jgi:hypothetical protein
MTSNYTALVNDREKEIIESTAARLHDALLVVDEKFQLVEFKVRIHIVMSFESLTAI